MKNVVNRAQDGQRKTFFPLVAEKKTYNCPATEVITLSVAYSLCQAVSQNVKPSTTSGDPIDGR